jgi:hypothetical protein
MALVAMCGLNSCSEDCDHNFIEHDFTQDIVGTWTYVNGEQAEALVIKADGSFTTTGVMIHGYLYEEKGTIKVENNKITLAFDGDKETFEGRLEFVAGKSLSLVMFDDNAVRLTYDYCDKDLSDEIVGMWVCNDAKDNMRIHSFDENGNAVFTGWSEYLGEFSVLENSNYKVVGDLIFQGFSNGEKYIASKLVYDPNGNAYGNIMLFKNSLFDGTESVQSWLRIKQNLSLAGQKYDYNNLYLTNVKGADKDIDFMGQTFNFSEMDGVKLDKMLKTLLFSFEFPDANTLKYSCHFSHQAEPAVVEAPIAVDGNKMTIKVSEVYPGLKDVDVYTFQDQDNCQMHMYMPTSSVEAFFGNLQVMALSQKGELDKTDAEAVKAVYDRVDAAIESINLTIILK